MFRLLLPLILALASSSAARAEIVSTYERDEIAGTTTFIVQIRSEDYRPIANENTWTFRCSPGGIIGFGWHYGGRVSGSHWIYGITYKVDDQSPQTFVVLDTKDYRGLIRQLVEGQRLVAKFENRDRSTGFDLTGIREAFAPFYGQCISD